MKQTVCSGITVALLLSSSAMAQGNMSNAAPVLPRPAEPFKGKVGRVLPDSSPAWPQPVKAPKGAPNIFLIMTDDTGFAASSVFGGPVPTPNLQRLADAGLRYNRFHTTGICSPTRAALLTGRNHHAVATGNIVDVATGFPGYLAEIPKSAANVAEVLRQNGYNTAFFGKHHNVPSWQTSASGPFDLWPTGLGFEYFFGFIGGDMDQWHPRLYRGITPLDGNVLPEGETLDHVLADDAVRWLRNQNAAEPDKPYLLYLAPGTTHAPHQVPAEWINRFRGAFDQGWDKVREESFARQKKAGIIPGSTVLTPRPAELPAWDSLSPKEKRVHARMMEVAAATLAYQDAQLGRILDEIDREGERGNTLILFIEGDNGASGEAGPPGTSNEMGAIANGIKDDVDSLTAMLDEMGSPKSYQNYSAAWAWAMNTPFRWMKQVSSHLGGVRNGMVLSWPSRIAHGGEIRSQFAHVTDVMPTLLEAAGVEAPSMVNGVAQQPIDGTSLLYSVTDPKAPEKHKVQYFEVTANRSIYADGWLANTRPRRMPWEDQAPAGSADTDYVWELFNLRADFSQAKDLAPSNPAKLAEMKALFDLEAERNHVFPLDDRFAFARGIDSAIAHDQNRSHFQYWGKDVSVALYAAPSFARRPFRLTADIEVTQSVQTGVLVANGSWFGGWSFYLKDGRPAVVQALSQRAGEQYRTIAPAALQPGKNRVEYSFTPDTAALRSGGTMRIAVNGEMVAEGHMPATIMRPAGLGETFDLGRDTGVPVTEDYAKDGAFGGKIINIDVLLGAPGTTGDLARKDNTQ